MSIVNISNNREVMWDMNLADKIDGVELKMHKPVRKNIALKCDRLWEGEHSAYINFLKVGDTYRLYYRAGGHSHGPNHPESPARACFCVAESKDGKTFTRPNLGRLEFNGSKDNNIVYIGNGRLDNFSVYYDENPNCPPDAKFKALSQNKTTETPFGGLTYLKSADGYTFEVVGLLPIDGPFDSLNLIHWVKETGKYRIYFRNFHSPVDNSDIPTGKHNLESIRDIRYTESEDFVTWTPQKRVAFTDGREDIEYYTNGITKYHRANIYFGMPARYVDRIAEEVNYKYLPGLYGIRHNLLSLPEKRGGSAITDTTLITSRDGYMFERTNECFMSPGPENGENWIYGDAEASWGMHETESDYPGEPNELSFFSYTGYRCHSVEIVRYTVRLDGLFSWRAGLGGGSVLTKPLTFDGNKLSINFATSGYIGYVRIVICDEDGNEIEGYDSTTLFGDSVNRPVDFQKPLSELSGKTVRLKFDMKDCDLYSFVFEK